MATGLVRANGPFAVTGLLLAPLFCKTSPVPARPETVPPRERRVAELFPAPPPQANRVSEMMQRAKKQNAELRAWRQRLLGIGMSGARQRHKRAHICSTRDRGSQRRTGQGFPPVAGRVRRRVNVELLRGGVRTCYQDERGSRFNCRHHGYFQRY